MNSFPPEVVHVAINEDGTGYESRDVATFNKKLNMINPAVFPLLHSDMTQDDALRSSDEAENENTPNLKNLVKGQFIQAKIDGKLHVRPNTGALESTDPLIDYEAIEKEVNGTPQGE